MPLINTPLTLRTAEWPLTLRTAEWLFWNSADPEHIKHTVVGLHAVPLQCSPFGTLSLFPCLKPPVFLSVNSLRSSSRGATEIRKEDHSMHALLFYHQQSIMTVSAKMFSQKLCLAPQLLYIFFLFETCIGNGHHLKHAMVHGCRRSQRSSP